MDWKRSDWMLLLAITLLAALLRLYQLGEIPPGFQFDEAFNANDADQVLAGNYPLFLPANGGREALYTYWQVAITALFGLSVYTLRLASALMGILAVPASYLLLRCILREDSRKIAAFTSLTLAISLWHIHFSRYGIRVIMMPVILSALFGLFWLGTYGSSSKIRLLGYTLSGLLTGLTVWTHPTGRLVPFVLIAYVGWLYLRYSGKRHAIWQGRRWDNPFMGLTLCGIVAFLVFLPLGLEFYRHPDFFLGHASEVSIFAQRVSDGTPSQILLHNLGRVLGMFSFSGDTDWTHNLSGRPVFDLLISIPFYLGLILWLIQIFRSGQQNRNADGLALLGCWLVVMLMPSIFSEAAPNYSRTLPALPAAFVAVGLGLNWLVNLAPSTPWLGSTLVALILFFSGGSTVYDYFVRFAQTPDIYYVYDTDKLDSLAYLQKFTENHEVYLSQLWGEKHATVLFLRGQMGIQSLDIADTIVLPPEGKGAVYAFPMEQSKRAQEIADRWPNGAVVEEIIDPHGQLLLANAILSPEAAQQWPVGLESIQPLAEYFFDSPTLVGFQAGQTGAGQASTGEVGSSDITLVWRQDEHTYRDLTTFVHLIDVEGNQVGQADKQPGNGSYRTPYWTTGERVIDRYPATFSDPCAGGERVQAVVGWYEWLGNNRRMPRVDAPGDTALAGEMIVPLRSQPRSWLPQLPEHLVEQTIAENLMLLGYDQREEVLEANAPLTLHLYWQGNQTFADSMAQVMLIGQGETVIGETTLAPGANWTAGEVLCRRLRLRMPDEIEPGEYQLGVKVTLEDEEETVVLNTVTVSPSTRLFVAPPLVKPVEAQFGDSIRLLGLIQQPAITAEENLQVELAWQAAGIPDASYKVFIHLLDEQGEIAAQSDAIPQQNTYPTNRWIQGEVVLDTHQLQLPAGFDPTAPYHLRAGLYEATSGQRLRAVDVNNQPLPDNVVDLENLK